MHRPLIALACTIAVGLTGCPEDEPAPTDTLDEVATDATTDAGGGPDMESDAPPTADTAGPDSVVDTGVADVVVDGAAPDAPAEVAVPDAAPDASTSQGWPSKQEFSNLDGQHLLAPGFGGDVSIEFDLEPTTLTDGVVGYAALNQAVTAYGNLNMLFRLDPGGFFQVRDGADYDALTTISYVAGEQYHVRIAADMLAKTYSVWVTPPGGSETQLAADYAFRADADNTITEIGKVFLRSELGDDLYYVRNHTISGVEPTPMCANGAITETCACGGQTYDAGAGSCCAGTFSTSDCPTEPVLAFPGAAGFGAGVTGGRGGQVIKVTTLNATGPGSLQEALSTPGPRIIVFEVSGVINGDLVITEPDVTIAGQTAPGAGITIAGSLYTTYCDTDVRNIIMRHVRVRHVCSSSDNTQCDAMQWSCAQDFILDHVSVSWGIDENFDLYSGANTFTIQDSVFENPCLGPPNSEFGGYHNYGVLNGPGGGFGSILRTAFINSKARNPALADGPYEVINTFVYSFRLGLIHNNPASGDYNVVGNYYRKGPQFSAPGGSQPIAKPFYLDDENTSAQPTYYFDDNYYDDFEEPLGGFDDPFTASHSDFGPSEILADPGQQAATAFDFTGLSPGYYPPQAWPAQDVPAEVWPKAGAWPRDVVSLATLDDVATFDGQFGCPIAEAGTDLMTGLSPTAPPTDADNDGMADAWEAANGLDSTNPNDHSTVMASGYTAIEDYINGLADTLVQ